MPWLPPPLTACPVLFYFSHNIYHYLKSPCLFICVLWLLHRKWDQSPTSTTKMAQVSRMMRTHTCTSRIQRAYGSHAEAFWEEQGNSKWPDWSQGWKVLVFIVVGPGIKLKLKVSYTSLGFLWSEQRRECPDFLTHLSRGGTPGKREGWGLKAVSSQTESDMFIVCLHQNFDLHKAGGLISLLHLCILHT